MPFLNLILLLFLFIINFVFPIDDPFVSVNDSETLEEEVEDELHSSGESNPASEARTSFDETRPIDHLLLVIHGIGDHSERYKQIGKIEEVIPKDTYTKVNSFGCRSVAIRLLFDYK